MSEIVSLKVNGVDYGGWKSNQITLSLETISGGFDIETSERWPGQSVARSINPGDECKLLIGRDVVITGWVDVGKASLEPESHTVRLNGRDRAGDLVDCSVIHSPGQFNNRRLEEIVEELIAPFNIKLIVQTNTGAAFQKFNINQGDKVFDTIDRLAKMRAVMMISDGKGNLLLTRAGAGRTATALVQGQNVKSAEVTNDHTERFSQYLCKGQNQGGRGKKRKTYTAPKGSATDPQVKRYRPLLVNAEGKADIGLCQNRAAWERSTRQGKALTVDITVAGWRQGNGQLWAINSLCPVRLPALKVNETLLISQVNFSLDDSGGQITKLKLTRKQAFELIPEPESNL